MVKPEANFQLNWRLSIDVSVHWRPVQGVSFRCPVTAGRGFSTLGPAEDRAPVHATHAAHDVMWLQF